MTFEFFRDKLIPKHLTMSANLAYKCIEFVNSKTDYSSFENIYMFTTYNLITRVSMNIFCCYNREKVFKKFRIEIDAFVSKKKLVHFAFYKPMMPYPFFTRLSILLPLVGENERIIFRRIK